MDTNNYLKFSDGSRADSGFESARNSLNPSMAESEVESTFNSGLSTSDVTNTSLSLGKNQDVDEAIVSLERKTASLDLDRDIREDPNYDMVYTRWMVADQHGKIPFHTAISQDKFDIVHGVLARCRYKNLLNMTDGAGWTPLAIAVMMERTDIVRMLVMYGADVTKLSRGDTPLHTACKKGNSVLVDLLTKPVDADFLEENPFLQQLTVTDAYLNKTNNEGMTALHLAVEAGHCHIVKILVKELGCDVNDRDVKNGDTCLNILMKNGGDLDMLSYLLQNDADPNIANRSGYTALHLAAAYGLHEVVHVLLSFTTADLYAMTPDEDFALDLACFDHKLAKCISLEMDNRLSTWRCR